MSSRSGPSGPNIARADRKRRPIELTLSEEAHAALERVARSKGTSRSQIVEGMIFADDPPKKKKAG